MKLHLSVLSAIVGVGALLFASEAHAASVELKVGSIMPTGSPWHTQLKAAAAKTSQLSGGSVELKVTVGPAMGDEDSLVKKLRIGQIQVAALTTLGAYALAPEVMALDLPLLYADDAERDYVLAKEQATLEKALLDKGFIALAWSDLGWVRFFSTTPRPTLDDMRPSKLVIWTGDPAVRSAWTKAGFKPVSVAPNDVVSSFSTGLVDAVSTTPSIALSLGLHTKAKSMTSQPWSSLTGVVVVDKKSWEGVPADLRPKLEATFRDLGRQATAGARRTETDAITAMKKVGLKVVPLTDQATWARMVEDGRDEVRSKVVPAAVYDEVRQHVKDFRAGKR